MQEGQEEREVKERKACQVSWGNGISRVLA